MKVFVSQPMTGKTKEEIESVFQAARADIRRRFAASNPPMEVEILSTRNYILPRFLDNDGHNREMAYMSHAIQVMSMADMVYFCPGASQSRGCTAELDLAKIYGLMVIGPEVENSAMAGGRAR